LVAPFDAVVTAVHVSEGESANGVVIELADTSSLEVVLEVDEVDIGDLAVGQPALITLETWPDTELESEVLAIAPIAKSSFGSALITYEVHLGLGETDEPVLIGMTANANLTTADLEGVLLVPNEAINVDRSAGTYSVSLVRGETVEEVEVTVGLHDGQHTHVRSGLEAGDELLVGNAFPSEMGGPGPGGGFMMGFRDQD
jgi:HlyD family secretion protein